MFAASHNGSGGVKHLWELFAETFVELGYDPHLLALYGEAEPAAKHAWTTFSSSRIAPHRIPRLVASITDELQRIGPVAVVSAMPAANVLFTVAASIAGVPTRIPSHHLPADTHHRLFRLLDRLVGQTRMATRIVCVSEAVRSSFNGYPSAYRDKIAVIRNALPPDVAALLGPLARLRDGVARTPAKLIAVGRLAGQKNYPTLLAAMAKVDAAILQIVGGGEDEHRLALLAHELGVKDRVGFLGHRAHLDALRLMSDADIFLQPSLHEGHSIAILEALTLGLPIIASDIPSQREALTLPDGTLCGELVPVLDADALAARINALVADRRRMGELSRLAVTGARQSSYDRTIDAYASLIRDEAPHRNGDVMHDGVSPGGMSPRAPIGG